MQASRSQQALHYDSLAFAYALYRVLGEQKRSMMFSSFSRLEDRRRRPAQVVEFFVMRLAAYQTMLAVSHGLAEKISLETCSILSIAVFRIHGVGPFNPRKEHWRID
jgi:hypothetical protein